MGQYVQNPDGTHSQQTVLTGSIVKEEVLTNSLIIAAGGNSTVFYPTNNLNCEYYVLCVECVTGLYKWKAIEFWAYNGKLVPSNSAQVVIDKSTTSSSGDVSARLPVKTARVSWRIDNADTIDLTFKVTVQRINGARLI